MAAHQDYPFDDTQDFADADRGLIATLDVGAITGADGRPVWDLDAYAFLDAAAPDTVDPSLWRQSQLCAKHGLYEVTTAIYAVAASGTLTVTYAEEYN